MLTVTASPLKLVDKKKKVNWVNDIDGDIVRFFKGINVVGYMVKDKSNISIVTRTDDIFNLSESIILANKDVTTDGNYIISWENNQLKVLPRNNTHVSGIFSPIPPPLYSKLNWLALVGKGDKLNPAFLDYDTAIFAFIQNYTYDSFIFNPKAGKSDDGIKAMVTLLMSYYRLAIPENWIIQRVVNYLKEKNFSKTKSIFSPEDVIILPEKTEEKLYLSKVKQYLDDPSHPVNKQTKEDQTKLPVVIDLDIGDINIKEVYFRHGVLVVIQNPIEYKDDLTKFASYNYNYKDNLNYLVEILGTGRISLIMMREQ